MKKFWACLLLLVMTIALIPQGLFTIDVYAASSTSGTTGYCSWKLDGTALTISGNSDMGHYSSSHTAPWGTNITSVTIDPGVTSIGAYAFYNCSNLTSVSLPNSIGRICNRAFMSCTSLSSIAIPNSVHTIEEEAFINCSSLTTSTLSNTLRGISDGAFQNCTSLVSIVIPDSVTSLGNWAFMGCNKLSNVTISNSVSSIHGATFSGCANLSSIIIPDSITSISSNAFFGCNNLKSVGYAGSESDRSDMTIEYGNDSLLNATWHYNGELFVTQIELIRQPTKLYYLAVELFDPSGSVLRLHFSDGTSEDITIDRYSFYNSAFNKYTCKKLDTDSELTFHGGALGETTGSTAFEFFGQIIEYNYKVNQLLKSISINDEAKNLVITITCLDNTTHTLTALGFIPRMGDSCPDGKHSSAFGELITDQGVFYVDFLPNCDGSFRMEVNGISSNTLVNGCKWYDMYMEKQWPADGGNALWNMLSHFTSFDGKITADNIDAIIDYTVYVNILEITDTSDGYTLPNGAISLMGWYRGEDLRNAIMKSFAIDSVDLSLSIHYDDEKDRYPVLGNGVVNDIHSLPSLTYKKGYWEMYWAETDFYPYSYAHYDEEGRILRFSHGKPIIAPTPVIESIVTDRITLTELDLIEYSIDKIHWQKSPVFINLNPATAYTVYQRYAAADTTISEGVTITTPKRTVDTPMAPVVAEKTDKTITLQFVSGYEYKLGDGDWTTNPVFIGLNSNTEYVFYQRVAETDTTYVSASSVGIKVTTLKSTVAAPAAPIVVKKTDKTVTLQSVFGYEYKMNNGEWTTNPVFTGLNPNTEYTFYQRTAETNTTYASDASAAIKVTTKASFVPGWFLDNGVWYYYNTDGTLATGWLFDGMWYYLNADGSMATGWVLDGNTWYYMNGGGAMMTGWVNVGGTWYYMNGSGAMMTGWVNDGGTWYYMNSSGAMMTGWVNDGGTWYYMNGSGAMMTGWVLDGGTWYYMNASGAMQTGWVNDGGMWYYMNSSGAMQTGWILDGGVWYYLNASGAWVA